METTYRHMIYMVLDELKGLSDDFYYTEDHIIFLLDKYRAFLLKQKYADIKRQISQSNFQTLEIYSNNTEQVPVFLTIATPKLHSPNKIYNYCTEERALYLGHNKFTKNCSYFYFVNNDDCLTINILPNVQDKADLKKLGNLKAVFESPSEVYKIKYPEADIRDLRFPLEQGLISPLLEMVVKDLSSAIFKPEDRINDSQDNTGNMATFIAKNMKSDLAKQIYD